MHQGRFPNVVAFVEGTMEKIFVNANFSYVHLVQLNNGSSWTLDAMKKQILTNFRVLSYVPDFVVVWFDRETMAEPIDQITNEMQAAINQEGVPLNRIAVLIPDRMSENLILSDEDCIQSEFNDVNYRYGGDGSNGKSLLKQLYNLKGVNYKETFHGAKLLKKCRLSRCAEKSDSANKFVGMLNLDCWWK